MSISHNSSKRLLVVDDSWPVRLSLERMLEDAGYHVRSAATFESGNRFVSSESFDLVLTDIILDTSSGLDLLPIVKRVSPDTPVIVITGQPDLDVATNALRLGAFDFLQKPIVRAELLRSVTRALAYKQVVDEKHELERRLAFREKTLSALFDASRSPTLLVSPRGIVMAMNAAASKVMGIEGDAAFGRNIIELIPEDLKKTKEVYWQRVLLEKQPVRFEARFDNVVFDVNFCPILDDDNTVTSVAVHTADLTRHAASESALLNIKSHLEDLVEERTQELTAANARLMREVAEREEAERIISQQKAFLAQIVENLPVGVVASDVNDDFRISLWNAKMEEIFKVDRGTVFGKKFSELMPPNQAKSLLQFDCEAIDRGEVIEIPAESFDLPAGRVMIKSVKAPVFGENGDPEHVVSIVEDVSKRLRMEMELVAAKNQAEAANQAKSAFLASMSHEIRTPMNAIIGLTDLTLKSTIDFKQRDRLRTVKEAARMLQQIITDILDLSKIEAGRMEIDAVDFDLHYIIKSTIRIMAVNAREKGLSLLSEIDNDVPQYVKGDPIRFRQILLNLVGNAIKFTSTGGIFVNVSKTSDETDASGMFSLVFTVSDTGMGIAEDKIVDVFNRFSQADSSTTRQFGGTGLGLTISSELVRMMGGWIWMDSTLGEGTDVFFKILFAQGNPEKAKALHEKQAASKPRSTISKRRILVAEDNPINAEVTREILTELGHAVFVVENGQQAVAAMRDAHFDLIFMDVEMPVMDGIAATRRIRRGEAGERAAVVPIIALTAHALVEVREKCRRAGMDDYMTKPVDFDQLVPVMESAIRSRSNVVPLKTAYVGSHSAVNGGERKQAKTAAHHAINQPAIVQTLNGQQQDINCVFDREGALARLLGNENLLDRIIIALLEDMPNRLANLEKAVRAADVKDIRLVTHNLSGALAAVGAVSCQHLSDTLREAAKNGELEHIDALFHQLQSEIDAFSKAIRQ